MPVLELQQLDGPLDVGESAAAELGVGGRIRSARQPLGVDTCLDSTDLLDRVGGDAAFGVADAIGHVQELDTEILIARDLVGAQQRLHFPRLRPLLVVRGVRGERTHHGTVASFGTQPRIDDQRRVVAGRSEHRADHLGDSLRPPHGLGLVLAGVRLAHEEHVGVGTVAEFATAEPAHTDHRDPRGRGATLVALGVLDRKRQRGVENCGPHARQRLTDLRHVEQAENIRGRDAGEFGAPVRPRRRNRTTQVGLSDRRRDESLGHVLWTYLAQSWAVGSVGVEIDHLG